jgi:hypothetical protein
VIFYHYLNRLRPFNIVLSFIRREKLRQVREQSKSAVIIQRMYRGFFARREFKLTQETIRVLKRKAKDDSSFER